MSCGFFGAGHSPDRLIEDDPGEVVEGDVDGVVIIGADAGGGVDQLGDGFAFDELQQLLRLAGFSLGLAPAGRALVGVEDADALLGGAVAVDGSAGIAADLPRPGNADGPKFDAVNAMPGEGRVGGMGQSRQRSGSGSRGGVGQQSAGGSWCGDS